jgi:hypothetical protein
MIALRRFDRADIAAARRTFSDSLAWCDAVIAF